MDAKLLTSPGNFAVVQLPGRKFPGVVFQGDSLNSLTLRVGRLLELIKGSRIAEQALVDEAEELLRTLVEIQASYEDALAKASIRLPYPK